ncbi:MAG: beta-propeller domain-containing protein, partial [Coriobacteriia bacterium]|nr:beta-propeller domain-containing protein [Coriobacteriia bacterium]
MKPENFKDAYRQEIEQINLDDDQLNGLLSAIEAEELLLQTERVQATAQAQTAYTAETATQGWTCPSSATPATKAKRFWRDWSTEARFAAVFSGLAGAAAMMFVGVIAWSVLITALPSTLPEPTDPFARSAALPTEGMVALVPADHDYTNVYTVIDQIREREIREHQEQLAREEQRRLDASRRTPGNAFGNMSAEDSADSEVFFESPTTDSTMSLRSEGGAEPDFSDTNIQVQGVQEGDILKTDGHYIYALSTVGLSILEANDGNPRVLSSLDFSDDSSMDFRPGSREQQGSVSPRAGTTTSRATWTENIYSKMYLEGDRLIALWTVTNDPWTSVHFTETAGVDIFDVSNPANPRYLTSFSLEGSLVSSRMIGDVLYLVCTVPIDESRRERGRPESFVPSVRHEDELLLAPASSIRIAPETRELRAEYTHIVAIDTSNRGQLVSQAALLGGSDDLYMSTNNLFLLSEGQVRISGRTGSTGSSISPRESRTSTGSTDVVGNATTVTRVELNNGHIDIGDSRRLPGIVNNQFSLDEKDDVLRIITTFTRWDDVSWSSGRGSDDLVFEEWEPARNDFTDTTVWTLDTRLNVIGSIDGFGIDEDLYSARFMGDIVYFVTFREIDPVYAVDLSDPANPR